MSAPKRTHNIQKKALDSLKEVYGFRIPIQELWSLERAIHNGDSLYLDNLTKSYTIHALGWNGLVLVAIYDKKRSCIDSFQNHDVIHSWIKKRPVLNKNIYSAWRAAQPKPKLVSTKVTGQNEKREINETNLPTSGRYGIPGTLTEWECIDLGCSHFDGDQCTLGGCFDPPQKKGE